VNKQRDKKKDSSVRDKERTLEVARAMVRAGVISRRWVGTDLSRHLINKGADNHSPTCQMRVEFNSLGSLASIFLTSH
jgi:hypothetical protein